jgi:hypothetical protein
MPEVGPQCPGVDAIRQLMAAGVAQHVGMGLDAEARCKGCPRLCRERPGAGEVQKTLGKGVNALAPDRHKGFWRDQVDRFHKDHPALIYSLVHRLVGAALFMLVDKYEKDERVAIWLKLMVLVISSVAILHILQPFGIQLF